VELAGLQAAVRHAVAAAHAAAAAAPVRVKCVVAAAGAGTSGIAALLAEPGASATLLEGVVPYAPAAFDDFLAANGAPPVRVLVCLCARLVLHDTCLHARPPSNPTHAGAQEGLPSRSAVPCGSGTCPRY